MPASRVRKIIPARRLGREAAAPAGVHVSGGAPIDGIVIAQFAKFPEHFRAGDHRPEGGGQPIPQETGGRVFYSIPLAAVPILFVLVLEPLFVVALLVVDHPILGDVVGSDAPTTEIPSR